MIKSITKAQVIIALKKEPLTRGSFFGGIKRTKKKCEVCAVGAILRYISFETWAHDIGYNINRVAYALTNQIATCQDPKGLIKEKNYLGALSCYFEDNHTKKQCIAFVKKHFPKKLTLEIKEDEII